MTTKPLSTATLRRRLFAMLDTVPLAGDTVRSAVPRLERVPTPETHARIHAALRASSLHLWHQGAAGRSDLRLVAAVLMRALGHLLADHPRAADRSLRLARALYESAVRDLHGRRGARTRT